MEYAQRKDLSVRNGDSIWLIVDGDVNYHNPDPFTSKNSQMERAYKIAKRNEIRIILSNPCFELWYLLHFMYTTAELRDFNAVYDHLKKYIPDYGKTKDDVKVNPVTQVWELVEYLLKV